MSENTQDLDLNEGVQIILNRMKSNPEEFFDDGGRWRWMFKDNMREVMTEIEKAAIFEGMRQVRRMEITAKAAATALRADEQPEEKRYFDASEYVYSGGSSLTGRVQHPLVDATRGQFNQIAKLSK